MQQQHRQQLNTPVHQQIFGALPNGLQIGERRPLNSRGRPTRGFTVPHLSLCLWTGPRTERAKSGGGHWGGAPSEHDSLNGSASVSPGLGKHLARTCLLNHADPCCWTTVPPTRKHEATEGERNRWCKDKCRISCGRGAGVALGWLAEG